MCHASRPRRYSPEHERACLGDQTPDNLAPASSHAYVYTRIEDTWQRTAVLIPEKEDVAYHPTEVYDDVIVMQVNSDSVYMFQRVALTGISMRLWLPPLVSVSRVVL